MPRKEAITKQHILDIAFLMAREEGAAEVTARKLAARVNCSTQPIFRVYKNMEELHEDIVQLAIADFDLFYNQNQEHYEEPFVNLGIAYIKYAAKEKNLFQLLFLSENRGNRSLYELLNGDHGNVKTEILKAQQSGASNPEELFMKMWIFIHGAASMTITGDYDLGEAKTAELLKDAYHSFCD